MKKDPIVLFVAGAGRSGSTLVGAMLGQADGMVSVGELRHIWIRGFVRNELCGCGTPFRSCPFWSEVTTRAFGGLGESGARRLRGLQARVDRMWRIPQLRAGAGSSTFRAALGEYAAAVRLVYRAVGSVSEATVVVDSSKSPSHAYVLDAAGGFDVRALHLVRDSRSVAFSWTRRRLRPESSGEADSTMPTYSPLRAAVDWDVMNLAAAALRRRMPTSFLRYEDLVAFPRAELARVLSELELPALDLGFVGDSGVRLEPSHTVSGNPSRFARGTVALVEDVEWKTAMTRGARMQVTAMTRPLLRAYGYEGNALRAPTGRTGPTGR